MISCVCVCVCVYVHTCVCMCAYVLKNFIQDGKKDQAGDLNLLQLLFVNQMKKKKPTIVEEQKKSNLFFFNSKMIKPCLAARYFYISKMNKGLLWG